MSLKSVIPSFGRLEQLIWMSFLPLMRLSVKHALKTKDKTGYKIHRVTDLFIWVRPSLTYYVLCKSQRLDPFCNVMTTPLQELHVLERCSGKPLFYGFILISLPQAILQGHLLLHLRLIKWERGPRKGNNQIPLLWGVLWTARGDWLLTIPPRPRRVTSHAAGPDRQLMCAGAARWRPQRRWFVDHRDRAVPLFPASSSSLAVPVDGSRVSGRVKRIGAIHDGSTYPVRVEPKGKPNSRPPSKQQQ